MLRCCVDRRVLLAASMMSMWLAIIVESAALAASPGELLEKAIYTEETVGNVDEAIKLYERIIVETKESRRVAAKAQLRLGLCYKKLGKNDQAEKAFQAVVDKYSDEEEIVAQANRELLNSLKLVPVPWKDHEQLVYHTKLANGNEIGTTIYMIDSTEQAGKPAWLCSTRSIFSFNEANTFSRVVCDKESFAPIESDWNASVLGVAHADYLSDRVEISTKGKGEPTILKDPKNYWDNEQCFQLFRRLPLEVGYQTTLQVVSSITAMVVPLKLKVPEKKTIEVPAGKFECFKVSLEIGQDFWVSADANRYTVRFDAGAVKTELARVQTRADEPMVAELGELTLTLPKGWQSYKSTATKKRTSQSLYLIDRDATVYSMVTEEPLAELDESDRTSVTNRVQSLLKKYSENLEDFKVIDPGIESFEHGEMKGAKVVFEHGANENRMTEYGWVVFGNKSAYRFRFMAPKEKYSGLHSELDSIVKSFRLK